MFYKCHCLLSTLPAKGGIIQQDKSRQHYYILQTENTFMTPCPEYWSGELADMHTAISFTSAAPAAITVHEHLSLLQTTPPDLMEQRVAYYCNNLCKLGT